GDAVLQILAAVRKHKAERQVSLKKELRALITATVPVDITPALIDLKGATRALDIRLKIGEPFSITIKEA
ncbi:MAG: hypothetical protein HC945_01250, partial [Nitrosarchaeum sp.]|nr:hypothetical protein [Nitrosarchaeum sp.]